MKERSGIWPLASIDEWVYDILPGREMVSVYAAYYSKGGDPGAWGCTDILFVKNGEWWLDEVPGREEQKLGNEYAVLCWFPLPLYPFDNNEDDEVALMIDGSIVDRSTGEVVNHLPQAEVPNGNPR